MKKILVAYFSASGVTKKVAERLSETIGADIFEILPSVPYTRADLNWMNKKSRSSVEMADRASRPEIQSKTDISAYDLIFVGFPVWWYREPSVIDTFMEQYDFGGKEVVPFATSGGSGLGESPKNIQALAPKAKVFAGKRLSANIRAEELKKWAEEITGE